MKSFMYTTYVCITFISMAWSYKCITKSGYTCVFPFLYGGYKYSICTTAQSEGFPWCATYTSNEQYYPRYWDYCPQSCYTCGVSNLIKSSCNDDVRRLAINLDFPWHALIKTKNKYENVCSGVIVNTKWVLSTATCVNQFDHSKKQLELKVGTAFLNDDEYVEYLEIEKIIPHEKYSQITGANDIALVKTKLELTLTDLVIPICVNVDISKVKVGAFGTLSGIDIQAKDWRLRGHRVTIQGNTDPGCNTPGMFCTNPSDFIKTPLSGSPFAMCLNNKCALVGLYSTKLPFSSDKSQFYRFTEVSNYLPWMYKNAK